MFTPKQICRIGLLSVAGAALLAAAGCTNKKVVNPLANVTSKQPDKVLFDRAEDALKHNRYDTARITLQTLINTYPDSEFIARAKLAVGDSWYAEGGTTALQQAEVEYNDFKTFFPNLPEAAEAQMKIANIHYQQMEKPDRDFTHAVRAEDEYRQMILQYPDSKLIPEAKQKLMEVQEVLADREFRIGRFYYLRQSFPAAIARLKTLSERYPLYSGADEALWLLGQAYEGQIENIRRANMAEAAKGKLIAEFTKQASSAYEQILTRYPMMNRAVDAQARLAAFHRPVPKATPEMMAQNKKEMESRSEISRMSSVLDNFNRHPNTARATKVGDPTLVDPEVVTAKSVVDQANNILKPVAAGAADTKVGVEIQNGGAPLEGQALPRSDAPAQPGTAPAPTPAADSGTSLPQPSSEQTGIQDLNLGAAPAADAPAQPGTSSSTTTNGTAPLPAPQQVNEVQQQNATGNEAANAAAKAAAAGPAGATASDSGASSSKKKKKKLFPF